MRPSLVLGVREDSCSDDLHIVLADCDREIGEIGELPVREREHRGPFSDIEGFKSNFPFVNHFLGECVVFEKP